MNPLDLLARALAGALALLPAAPPGAGEQRPLENLAPNGEFREGDRDPAHWSLSGARGRWLEREILEVTGSTDESNHWRSAPLDLPSGQLYRFAFRARRLGGSGTVISGPAFANRDFLGLDREWRWHQFVFRVSEDQGPAVLRLGEWHSTGTVEFDAVRLEPVLPAHRRSGPLALGEGEAIEGNRYAFRGSFAHEGSNYHRPLASANASFNTDRWVFGSGSQVTYLFSLPGSRMLAARAAFAVNYHLRGACEAEASAGGERWHRVALQETAGDAAGALPAALFPAPEIRLRLRAIDGPDGASTFQVNRIDFDAELDRRGVSARGSTSFATVRGSGEDLAVEEIGLGEGEEGAESLVHLVVRNLRREPVPLALRGEVAVAGEGPRELAPLHLDAAPGGLAPFAVALPAEKPGVREVKLRVRSPAGGACQVALATSLHDYHRADYGSGIEGVAGRAAVWWCTATRKVPPRRRLPRAASRAASLSAAKGDFEAVQVVVQAREELQGLRAVPGALAGPGGASIPASHVQILRVAYHEVHHPTDATGRRGRWPDALPPLSRPLAVAAGENQPLWVLVQVPRDAAAGDYRGEIALRAEGWSAAVPLELHVWDFALPERNHLETAFGFSPGEVFRYHGLRSEAERRQVLDFYFRSFSEHRISPYDPAPLDGIGVRFLPEASPPRAELDFGAFDRAMTRAAERFHFTGFRLPIRGMGGGTFHSRHEPEIAGFGEETPQYQAMFSSYAEQLEARLREKGWLGLAYVYWFDEPEPKDYEFVKNGMARLERYAPGLRRMLTEEPREELTGAVDIWCPVSFNYDHQAASKRRGQGEAIWWYICTGPKAPYCTLFIDHPATELRVWLWQTWQREIAGILIWQATYWTSSAAFPDQPQNPYEDPMSYVSGYSTPRGVKRFWGNGDGRFIYPPEAAAVPGAAGPDPVLEPPVSSIRWEMLREGIEDYELLWLLRDLLGRRRERLSPEEVKRYEALLEVPEDITRDLTHFTTDPGPIYARRTQVAQAIERLARLE